VSEILGHDVLYRRYRTIAYENVNPFQPEGSGPDPNIENLLPEDRHAKILDVGCGMGHFIQRLLSKGYTNVSGVEVSPEQADFCREKVTKNVFLTADVVGFLSERPESLDCIVLLDVIEHLPRDLVIPTLSAIFNALKPGGSFVVKTGNLASLSGMFIRYIDFTHESGFTENSLRQVLRAVGFKEIDVRGNVARVYSWRSYIRIVLQRSLHFFLRVIYSIDRGWNTSPLILSPMLIARAIRK
jgi:SAM-dependent methyltransferase